MSYFFPYNTNNVSPFVAFYQNRARYAARFATTAALAGSAYRFRASPPSQVPPPSMAKISMKLARKVPTKRYSKTVPIAVKQYVHRSISMNTQTKAICYSYNNPVEGAFTQGTVVFQNLITLLNGGTGIGQGDQESQRKGDEIHPQGLDLRLTLNTSTINGTINGNSNATTFFRVTIFRIGAGVTPTETLVYRQTGDTVGATVDTSYVTQLYDRVVRVTAPAGTVVASTIIPASSHINIQIPKRKLGSRWKFSVNSATLLKDYQYFIALTAVSYGTAVGGATSGSYAWNGCLHFKDA